MDKLLLKCNHLLSSTTQSRPPCLLSVAQQSHLSLHLFAPLLSLSQQSLRSGELPACVSTSAGGPQDQPEAQWADFQERRSLTPPSPPLPRPPSRYGERRARGCAGVTPPQLDGYNTELKEERTPCSTGRTRLTTSLFWILHFSALHRCLTAAGCSQDLLSFWGSFTCLHLAPDASVICCRWVPGAARNMPAGFQQLGGEVIYLFINFFHESFAQLKYVVGLVVFTRKSDVMKSRLQGKTLFVSCVIQFGEILRTILSPSHTKNYGRKHIRST